MNIDKNFKKEKSTDNKYIKMPNIDQKEEA